MKIWYPIPPNQLDAGLLSQEHQDILRLVNAIHHPPLDEFRGDPELRRAVELWAPHVSGLVVRHDRITEALARKGVLVADRLVNPLVIGVEATFPTIPDQEVIDMWEGLFVRNSVIDY